MFFYDTQKGLCYIFVDQNSKMVDIENHFFFTLDYMGKWTVIFSETTN